MQPLTAKPSHAGLSRVDGHFMDAGSPSRCILISAAPTHLAQGLALAVLGADIAEALRVGDVHLGLVRGALLGLLPQVAEVLVTCRTGRGQISSGSSVRGS